MFWSWKWRFRLGFMAMCLTCQTVKEKCMTTSLLLYCSMLHHTSDLLMVWGSVAFPYFDLLLDIEWGEGGGGGLTILLIFWGTFCLNIGNFGPLKSYLTLVQNPPIPKLPHNVQNEGGGGGRGHFRTKSKINSLFFWCLPLVGGGSVINGAYSV